MYINEAKQELIEHFTPKREAVLPKSMPKMITGLEAMHLVGEKIKNGTFKTWVKA